MDQASRDGAAQPSGSPEVDAVRILLTKLGVSPQELVDAGTVTTLVPTFAEYVPKVAEAASGGTRRVYRPYWRRLVEQWGARHLDELSATEIRELAAQVQTEAVSRRNTRGGRSAAEHFISATRCVYAHAVADRLIAESANPARHAPKPRRLPSTRRALPKARMEEINHVAATTGNDPSLDALLLRIHTETACRRGGALALRPEDLDEQQCLVRLLEKGGTVRWQPVSPTLMAALKAHDRQRGVSTPGRQLLRYVNGKPITRRRYDYLWQRIGKHLPWVARQQISTHWLRHTTLTWVERNFGYAVARAYAGHSDRGHDAGATTTYIRATIHEVTDALAAMTGEEHPMASATRTTTAGKVNRLAEGSHEARDLPLQHRATE